uniref:Intu_longin_1 domain-containing protein n=1 Tax=Caenorhabditis tropicalis TaxID=1561998 RepID=A0A1I7U2A5_9PELO
MEAIANPLYFFSNLSLNPPSCSNVVRFIDVLEFFFVAHPQSGRKEGEEHRRVMYFHPKGEQFERQTEITGFAEAVVNFTENFLSTCSRREIKLSDNEDGFDFRTVTTQRTEHVYIRTEDDQFILGVSLSKQLSQVSDYPLFQPAIRSILSDAYKMFRMFFGTFSSFIKVVPDDIPKFRERLDFFFSKYIPLLKVHKMPLLDHLGGVEFLRMSGPLYLNVVSLITELREEFPIIEKIMILYQDKLLYYQLSKRDLPSLFRYLTHNLLPTTLAPELEHSGRNTSKGRYLRGPTDLTTDAPLLGDESLSVVHLHSDSEDLEELIGYQMMVYRCLNATVCMFVRNCGGERRDSDASTRSSPPQNGIVSRRLLRNIDQFLETELALVASKIGDEIGDEKFPEATDFHYIYFNPSSLSMTSSLSTSPALSVAASGSASKVLLPPVDVNRLVCDTMSNFVSETEEFGECFVKSSSDWWIVIKKVNSRLLVLILPPSSYTSSLADVQSKTATIVKSHFEAIFFS